MGVQHRKPSDYLGCWSYLRGMDVTFTKVDAKRYFIAIDREYGPALVPRQGPGYDDLMPHDLAHYVVEEYFEIELGVWGQLAAGGCGIFAPAPEDNSLHSQRRGRRIAAVGHADMARSEQLVVITLSAWERSIDRVKHHSREFPIDIDAEALRGAVSRMAEVARRWQALQHGASLTFTWPNRLTFEASKSRRGRQRAKRNRTLTRH
jgi:hypothetical protein